MKKRILSLISLLLVVFLVSCGTNTDKTAKSEILSNISQSSDSVFEGLDEELSNSSVASTIISDKYEGKPVIAEKPAVKLNGVPLSEYTIIYKAGDNYAKFAAENLEIYLEVNYDIEIHTIPDRSVKDKDYEILVGDTNRNVSFANESALTEDKYGVCTVGTDIVLKASGYMIGGAARGFLDILESAKRTGNVVTATVGTKPIVKKYQYKTAENALLYIGDGMGFNHIELAKIGGMRKFYAEDMPNKGEVITYSYSVEPLKEAAYTDSAAAGTALATGYKTKNGFLGVDHNKKALKNIRELVSSKGGKTAVLTTDAITGATPAAFLVHRDDRNSTGLIKQDIEELISEKDVTVVSGELGDGLLDSSKSAFSEIIEGNKGFFMMLEEGHIDKHSHNNKAADVRYSVERFNEVIANAMEFTLVRGDTVLIVTADHETGGITKSGDKYVFTTGNHTNKNVPIFAMGKGTETLTSKPINNVLISRFIAKVFGENNFGDMSITQ